MRESISKGIRMLCLPVALAVAGSFALAEPLGTPPEHPDRDAKQDVRVSKKRGPKAPAGQYIVVLEENIRGDLTKRSALLSQVENLGGAVYRQYSALLNGGFAATLPATAVSALQRSPYVAFVEPDEVISLAPEQVSGVDDGRTAGGAEHSPGVEWGADRIDQRYLPLDGQFDLSRTGLGNDVYVVGTGIRYTHEVFQDPDGSSKARPFFDFMGGSGQDCNGHGTHIAGTIHSIAPDATLWSVRVMNCAGSGMMSGVLNGLEYILENAYGGTVVIPLGSTPSNSFDLTVRNLISAGHDVVVAGPQQAHACLDSSPSRVVEAITVGVSNSSDTVPQWSPYGSCVDIHAPGIDIRSAWHSCDTCYDYLSGTSVAAAHVAGVSALYNAVSLEDFLVANATLDVLADVAWWQYTPNRLLYACDGAANMASAHDRIVEEATENVVTDAGPASPNRLLYLYPGAHLYFYEGGNWALDRGNQRYLPMDGDSYYSSAGVGVHVYVLGTGIHMTHQEFTGRADCFFDWEPGNNCEDENGRGTYIASLVAGDTYGWADGANVHAVRVADDSGAAATADVVAGLDAIAEQGEIPGVVVLPLGGGVDPELDAAVQRVIDAGFYVVAAAGNENSDACNSSPAGVPEILTVGATDISDARAGFSNWGSCVDLFAPGVDITGAWNTDDSASRVGSGTDAAAAFVAGAVAVHAERGDLRSSDRCIVPE